MNRREFLAASAATAATLPALRGADTPLPAGKAECCIFVWLGGGMGQLDTFDPKAVGKNKGTPKTAGSLYPSIDTAVKGVKVCEHLPKLAPLMDRVTAVRS